MKMKAREALDTYYEQAGSWGADQQAALSGSRRTAWIVASLFAIIALVEAIAIISMLPLKTVEPYTLLVDKQTGYVQALKPLESSQISGNTALTQSFLVQYVIARESFNINAIQTEYRKVALWSEGAARNEYVAGSQASNPDSLIARMPRNAILETRVKSVSPMAGNTAMVRFETVRRDAAGQVSAAQHWVATIQYRYSGEPMQVEDRYVNPLGFQVTRYQRSAEAFQPQAPGDEPAAAAAAPAGSVPAGTQPGPVMVVPTQPGAQQPGANPLNQVINRRPAPPPQRRPGEPEITL